MTIGFLEKTRKAVVPPILGTKRELYKKETKDFHFGQTECNVWAGHSCVLKLGDSQISSPVQRCKMFWTGHTDLGITRIKIVLTDRMCD